MSRDGVEEYVERSKSLIDSSPQMGEENTKVKLIQPLIELLGWDTFSSEVELEYPIQIGQGHARADYALLLDGSPAVFVEAKGCDTTLSDGARSQLKSYMRQKGAGWGLLTNGQRFEVLKRREDSDLPDEVLLASLSIEELRSNWNVLELLSRELVRSGEAVTRANRIRARKRATSELQSGKEEIADEVAKLIVNKVGDTLTQEIETESKEFIDDLINVLGTDEDTTIPREDPDPEPSSTEVATNEYVVAISDGSGPAKTFSGEKQADVMASVVDHLVENYDLLNEIGSLPYVPGKKNAILNSEPKHPSGEEMRLCRSLSNGCFLYVSLNKKSKIRHIDRFVSMCGLTAEFDGNW
ncbi:restriction endonuclease subunit R [Halobacteriales archaeon QS_8_65_32]|nr:MAG: restriction endonuclease subunit R [Halobacteriales archaeon QS_8_65_32]